MDKDGSKVQGRKNLTMGELTQQIEEGEHEWVPPLVVCGLLEESATSLQQLVHGLLNYNREERRSVEQAKQGFDSAHKELLFNASGAEDTPPAEDAPAGNGADSLLSLVHDLRANCSADEFRTLLAQLQSDLNAETINAEPQPKKQRFDDACRKIISRYSDENKALRRGADDNKALRRGAVLMLEVVEGCTPALVGTSSGNS